MFSSVKSLVVLGCLAASALAQNIAIGTPNALTTMSPGQNITVQVNRPDSLTGSTEVGLAICFVSCASYSACEDIDLTQQLGVCPYTGGFNPEFQSGGWSPYQNFTVQVPSSFSAGDAILSVTQLALVGAGNWPYLQTVNNTIVIQ